MHLSYRGGSYTPDLSVDSISTTSDSQQLCYRGISYHTPINVRNTVPQAAAALRYRGADYLVGRF